jgi:hypothetical protein
MLVLLCDFPSKGQAVNKSGMDGSTRCALWFNNKVEAFKQRNTIAAAMVCSRSWLESGNVSIFLLMVYTHLFTQGNEIGQRFGLT